MKSISLILDREEERKRGREEEKEPTATKEKTAKQKSRKEWNHEKQRRKLINVIEITKKEQ
jgi:hypothetical protein